MIDAQGSGQNLHVRRNDVAGPDADDVAGNQFAGGNDLPVRIAQHARADLEPSPQRLHHARGATLLPKAQHRIDDQQCADNGEIGVVPQHERQNHDQFEHPCRQAPEFPEELEDRVFFLLGHLVVAVLLPARFLPPHA